MCDNETIIFHHDKLSVINTDLILLFHWKFSEFHNNWEAISQPQGKSPNYMPTEKGFRQQHNSEYIEADFLHLRASLLIFTIWTFEHCHRWHHKRSGSLRPFCDKLKCGKRKEKQTNQMKEDSWLFFAIHGWPSAISVFTCIVFEYYCVSLQFVRSLNTY